jgi:hypothetical protein
VKAHVESFLADALETAIYVANKASLSLEAMIIDISSSF